jgi:hypothetical protein
MIKINILGYWYRVILSPQRNINGNLGSINCENYHINIAKELPQANIESTLIHEILEGINLHLGLRLRHNVICALETGMYQSLTENGVDLSILLIENADDEET